MQEETLPYTCETCGKSYSTKGNLKNHKITHTGKKDFSCNICPKNFQCKALLEKHIQHVHNQIRNHECDVCGRAFSYTSHLKLHKARHEKVKKFFCEICNYGFHTRSDLNRHVNSKLTHSVPCRFCDKISSTREEHRKHLSEHNQITRRRLFCKMCQKRMTSKKELIKHNKAHSINYTCGICKKSFLDEASFQKHSHDFKCGICERKFEKRGDLAMHLRIVHLKKPKQKCEICLKFVRNLKQHQEEVHKKKKLLKCDICNKSFSRAFTFKRHLLTHTNERPYSCDFCNKSFSQSNVLKNHLVIHTDERPYSCDLCKKRFTRLDTLKDHLLTHTNKRPYTCDICNASFIKNYELKKHIKSNTCDLFINSTYSCELCNTKFICKVSLDKHNNSKHPKKSESSKKKQILDLSLTTSCVNKDCVKPTKKTRILQTDLNKISVVNKTSCDENLRRNKKSFFSNAPNKINSNNKLQNFKCLPDEDTSIKSLLKYGFTSSKSNNIEKSAQDKEKCSNQIQRKINCNNDSNKKEKNINILPSTTVHSVCILCKNKFIKSNHSEEDNFDKCGKCSKSICNIESPLKETMNNADESISKIKISVYKKPILELYELIEKRSLKY